MNTTENKIKSGIIGAIVGDALGVPTEFYDRETLQEKPVTDMIGWKSHDQPPGTWSDDSSMIIATMDAIINTDNLDYDHIMKNFLKWLDGEYTPHGKVFDMGRTTLKALYFYNNFSEKTMAYDCGGKALGDNGNGSLMRILPVVLYCYVKDIKGDALLDVISKSSSLTHGHEISIIGCYLYAGFVYSILDGSTIKEAYDRLDFVDLSSFKEENIEAFDNILDQNLSSFELEDINSSGYVVHTLEAVFWCLLKHNSFKDTIIEAINLGHDTDTIACIAGGAAGIFYGMDEIPKEWVDGLVRKDYLCSITKEFSETITRQ